MKAKTIFLTSVTCAMLLATQIANLQHITSKPSPTEPSIPQFSECLISDFPSIDIGQADKEVPHKAVTPPKEFDYSKTDTVPEKIAKIGTQVEPFSEPPEEEVASPQSDQSTIPKMGDTRVVDGQKQCYFLGFGWIDDNDEPNECIYPEDMYENGNRIGSVSGGILVDGEGDINKMVGTMD